MENSKSSYYTLSNEYDLMSVCCYVAIDIEFPALNEKGNITFKNLPQTVRAKLKAIHQRAY